MSWIGDLRRLLGRARRAPPASRPPGGVTCHEALECVFEWLDGELDPDVEPRIGEHLNTCAVCYPILKFERAFREAVSRAAGETAAPERVRAKVVASLEGAGLEGD